jgi:hypothetical protein
MFTLTGNTDCFNLAADVTFEEYVYAVNLGRSMLYSVLPSTFPSIALTFNYHLDSLRRYHPCCATYAPWYASAYLKFETALEVLQAAHSETIIGVHCVRSLYSYLSYVLYMGGRSKLIFQYEPLKQISKFRPLSKFKIVSSFGDR